MEKVRADSVTINGNTLDDDGYFAHLYTLAVRISAQALVDKVDLTGNPILQHVLRVAGRMKHRDAVIVAVLHDTLEDSDLYSELDLREVFPVDIVDSVICLTRREGEPYLTEYLNRVISNKTATLVKYFDLMDNMDPRRSPIHITSWGSQMDRYLKAMRKIHEALISYGISPVEERG